MKRQVTITILALMLLALTAGAATQKPTTLFDGRTLAGWEGDPKTFRVADGAVVAGTLKAKIPRNEFLCTTREYDNFVLRLKFKLLGEGVNAGVQFRSKRVQNSNEVSGYQADLGDGWWGSLYDEARRQKTLVRPDAATGVDALVKRGEWNDYLIRAEGKRVRLEINGRETIDYTEPDDSIPQTGVICLQIHSGGPSEAWYKDVVIEKSP